MKHLFGVVVFALSASAAQAQWTATGPEVPSLAIFDQKMQELMQQLDVSSAQLTLTWKGRLVLARGYSWNPGPDDIIVQPDSLFRIASVTKPITSTLINRLVQDGQLDLEQALGEFVDLNPLPGYQLDPRMETITLRNLLEHRAGFGTYNTLGYDPLFLDQFIAEVNGVQLPINQDHIRSYMNGVELYSNPGTAYGYSNYGYLLLKQVIEAASGMSFQDYFDSVFNPIGVWDIRQGRSALGDRYPNEVFYDSTGYSSTTVLDNTGTMVPNEYGGFSMSNLEGVGGFVASAVEIAKWMANLDDPFESGAILNNVSLDRMFGLYENYPLPYQPGNYYYAQGWSVRDYGNGVRTTWHDGSLPGTSSLAVRHWSGLNFFVSLNRREETGQGTNYAFEIENAIYPAVAEISDDEWPTHDLFPQMLPVIFRNDFD